MSWLFAFALAALLLPSYPAIALSLAAGQLIMGLNFFFLEKLVKLFTQAGASSKGARRTPLPGRFFGIVSLKLSLVYGGAFVLIRTQSVLPAAFAAGLSIPLLTIFLKSILLAFGSGPSSWTRRATSTTAISGNAVKLAAFLFLIPLFAAMIAMPGAAGAQTPGEAPHAATHAAAPAHSEAHEEGLPNWVVILNDYFPNSPVVHWMYGNQYLVFGWLAGVTFLGFVSFAMRKPTMVPGPLQNALEWIIESMEDVCGGMLGKHLDRYFPYIMAVFFYILTANLIGIIPGFKSSTSTLDVTLALALITFAYVQFSGIRNLGILGYIDHLAGSPRDVVGFAMLPVMVPVHVLGELVKPVSLSCRLFGNIFGEDTLIVVFVGVAALCLRASLVALAVPPMAGITALFMLLQTLTAIVQALIFSLLTTVYLYMMLPHESHEAHGHGEVPATPHHGP